MVTNPTPKLTTGEQVIRATLGLCLSERYGSMSTEEREGLLHQHEEHIGKGVRALEMLLADEHKRGVSDAWAKLRRADAFDPLAVDDVMAAQLDPDENAIPVEVPRGPFAGGF